MSPKEIHPVTFFDREDTLAQNGHDFRPKPVTVAAEPEPVTKSVVAFESGSPAKPDASEQSDAEAFLSRLEALAEQSEPQEIEVVTSAAAIPQSNPDDLAGTARIAAPD